MPSGCHQLGSMVVHPLHGHDAPSVPAATSSAPGTIGRGTCPPFRRERLGAVHPQLANRQRRQPPSPAWTPDAEEQAGARVAAQRATWPTAPKV